jgi:iron-sulfur cluster insertion protein
VFHQFLPPAARSPGLDSLLSNRHLPVVERADGNQPESYHVSESEAMIFTPAAAAKVRELILEEANPELKLRVYITGGGCSGFQYGFTFDEKVDDGDVTVMRDEVTLVVDPLSFQYLEGAEVDYTESLQGARFVIRNPNAATTCGCGSSFGLA